VDGGAGILLYEPNAPLPVPPICASLRLSFLVISHHTPISAAGKRNITVSLFSRGAIGS